MATIPENLTQAGESYSSLIYRARALAIELSAALVPGATEPLSKEEFVAQLAALDPERLRAYQTLLAGKAAGISGGAKAPFERMFRLFGEFAQDAAFRPPPPTFDSSHLPESLQRNLNPEGILLVDSTFSDKAIEFIRQTPDADTFSSTFSSFSWVVSVGSNKLTADKLKDQIRTYLKAVIAKLKFIPTIEQLKDIKIWGMSKGYAPTAPLAHLYGMMGYGSYTADAIAADLGISPPGKPSPGAPGPVANAPARDQLTGPEQRLLVALSRLTGEKTPITVTISTAGIRPETARELAKSRREWGKNSSILEGTSTAVIKKMTEKLGVIVPARLAPFVSVEIDSFSIPLSRLYENTSLTRKTPLEIFKELAIGVGQPPDEGLRAPRFTVARAQFFNAYFQLIYGPNYSLEDADLERYMAEIDPNLMFNIPEIGPIGEPWIVGRPEKFFQWWGHTGGKIDRTWDARNRTEFRGFVRHLRGEQPEVSDSLINPNPELTANYNFAIMDGYLTQRYGRNYELNPEHLERYLAETDDRLLQLTGRVKERPLPEVATYIGGKKMEFMRAVLQQRGTCLKYNYTNAQRRMAVIELYRQMEAEGLNINDILGGSMGDVRQPRRYFFLPLTPGKVAIETAPTVVENWRRHNVMESPGVYPEAVRADYRHHQRIWSEPAKSMATALLTRWVSDTGMTYDKLLELRSRKAKTGNYWSVPFSEQLHKTTVSLGVAPETTYYRFVDLFDMVGLNDYWDFAKGVSYEGIDGNAEQKVLDKLRELGIKDVPTTVREAVAKGATAEGTRKTTKGKDLDEMDEKEIGRLLDAESLTGVVLALADNPTDLADFLALFGQAVIERHGLDDTIKSFAGLEIAHDDKAQQLRTHSPDRENALTDSLLAILKERELGTDELTRLELIYRRILRRWVDSDPAAALAWIRSRYDAVAPVLQPLFIKLHQYFSALISNFIPPPSIRTELRLYQKEAIRFFSMPEHRRGLLADEPGMGKSIQAIGIAENTGVKKILWITTNSNKQTVAEELGKHRHGYSEDKIPDDTIILSGNFETLKKQLEKDIADKKYIIVNYEALRAIKLHDEKGYQKLIADLGMVIVDEAQLADNAEAKEKRERVPGSAKRALMHQAEAVHTLVKDVDSVNSELQLLLLSATPVQNRFERYYNQLHLLRPDLFDGSAEDRASFKSRYIKRGAEGLLDLHHTLQHFQLRRKKSEVMPEMDPTIDAAQQPKALPKKVELPYQEKGGFYMTDEQAKLYALTIADFDAVVEKYKNVLFPKLMDQPEKLAAKVDKFKKSHLRKLEVLFHIVTNPRMFGLKVNPRLEALKKEIKEAIVSKGEKPIVWVHHQDVGDEVEATLAELSQEGHNFEIGRYDGTPRTKNMVTYRERLLPKREVDRIRFQESRTSEPRAMLASLDAGGVGLTLTAGNPTIYYQQHHTVTRKIQSMDRNHRVDGRFPRHTLEYSTMVAMLPEGFVDAVRALDPKLADKLAEGTVDQTLYERIRVKQRRYALIQDGLMSEQTTAKEIERDLVGSIDYQKPTDEAILTPLMKFLAVDEATAPALDLANVRSPIEEEPAAPRPRTYHRFAHNTGAYIHRKGDVRNGAKVFRQVTYH